MSVAFTSRIDVQFSVGVWTSLGTDVLGEVIATLGISGNRPTDVIASSGELHFDLNNSAQNSGHTQGWYSPAAVGVRTGWTYGVPVRLVITYAAVDYVRFRGKVSSIDPVPGVKGTRRVHVVCTDPMADLIDARINGLAIAVSQTEDVLISDVISALPSTAQPPATNIAAGLDTYAYAFDKVGAGANASQILKDVVLSSLGALFSTGDGTVTYKTRRQRGTLASLLTFSNDMLGVVVPSTLQNVYNRVRATVHPKNLDAAATTVLYGLSGTPPLILSEQTVTLWGTYRDPTNTLKLIGGISTVTPIVATTDYTGNAASDGSSTNLTGNISIVTTAFATTAKFVVTNSGPDAYLTKLQIRGKGVYDNGPQTFESYVAMSYGDRPIDIDMVYQDSPTLGQSVASFIAAQYDNPGAFVNEISFVASSTATFMAAALTIDPISMITITETLTGLAAQKAIVQSIELRITMGNELRARYKLAPSAPYAMWQLGVAGHSEIGSTTILGF